MKQIQLDLPRGNSKMQTVYDPKTDTEYTGSLTALAKQFGISRKTLTDRVQNHTLEEALGLKPIEDKITRLNNRAMHLFLYG